MAFYRDVVASHGYEEVAAAVHERWGAGDRDAAADRVNENLLDAVAVAGPPDRAREMLRDVVSGPADAVLLSFPDDVDDEQITGALEAIPEPDR